LFELVTRIDQPHKAKINRLVFHPKGVPLVHDDGAVIMLPLVATASDDKSFKLWQMSITTNQKSITGEEVVELSWYCRSTGVWRDLPVTDLCFSQDGSVLAASFGHLVTLWHPLWLTLQSVLAFPAAKRPIQKLAFMHSDKQRSRKSHFLAATTSDGFYVWHVLSGNLTLVARMPVRLLAVDALNERFIVTAKGRSKDGKGTLVCSFDPAVDKTVKMESFIGGDVMALVSIGADLMYMSETYDLVTLSKEAVAVPKQATGGLDPATPGFFSSLFGATLTKKQDATLTSPSKIDMDLFEAPSHVIPPVTKLYSHFMACLLAPAANPVIEDVIEDAMDVDEGVVNVEGTDIWMTSHPSTSPWLLPVPMQSRQYDDDFGLIKTLELYFREKMHLIDVAVDSRPVVVGR
jgi:NET1-associated nuclear protein 1 (U3 small nucleolar RNA-associated protein 17)